MYVVTNGANYYHYQQIVSLYIGLYSGLLKGRGVLVIMMILEYFYNKKHGNLANFR